MSDAEFYRGLARHCRALLRVTGNPELLAQLRAWAVECDPKADRVRLRSASRSCPRYSSPRHEKTHLLRGRLSECPIPGTSVTRRPEAAAVARDLRF
jgi:hypothetical protein